LLPTLSKGSSSVRVRMLFTKEEVDEIKDALGDSLNYYKDLLDVNCDGIEDLERKKKNIEYARSRIKIIESIKKKLK
jgi:ppGpp synthetase/RelA/SpoT-type nucleotidyltranferase